MRRAAVTVSALALVAMLGAVVPAAAQSANSLPLNTIRDVGAALEACWRPPPIEDAFPGMQVTLVFSFNRNGAVMGEPRFTYSLHEAPTRVKAAYQRAAVDTLNRCTPLRFTSELGGAIAGHPFAVRFIDNRRIEKKDIEKREKSI